MIRTLLATAAFALTTQTALAAEPSPQPAPKPALTVPGEVAKVVLPHFDADSDGRITPNEFDRGLDLTFNKWDLDRDTYLLPSDLPTQALKAYADKNGDQLVTYAEYLTPMLLLRNRIDTNRDRLVTAPEWNAFLQTQRVTPPEETTTRD